MAKHILRPLEKRCGVRIYSVDPSTLDPREDLEAPPEGLVESMQFWCQETGCGRRTAYDIFEFKTEVERTMFTVRWS